MKHFFIIFVLFSPFVAYAGIVSKVYVDNIAKNKADDDNVLHLSGGALNDSATIKLTADDNISTTLNGNGISVDISHASGNVDATLFAVKDDMGNETTMLGVSADGTNGLKYTYMGGTYSSPAMKMTKAGNFTFGKPVVVGAPTEDTTSSTQADTVGARNTKINSVTSKVEDKASNSLVHMWIE